MFNLSIFAERLSELMFDNDVNAPKLANHIGIHRTTITRYLACNKAPSVQNIILIANYFNCTIDFLIGKESENYPTKFKQCPPFNQQLKFLFKHFGKSKSELRDEMEIPESIIFDWLRGDFTPSIFNIVKLAEFFDCSVDYVLGRVN